MARHRDIRNLDYEEEYDEAYDDAVYGHSVDEHEYGISPSTEQYLYSQRANANYGIGAYFTDTEKIKEEEEDLMEETPDTGHHSRRDSSSFQRPRLSSEDEIRLNSVLDELRNVVGDQFSEAELIRSVLEHHYDFESSLNSILNRKSTEAARKQETDSRSKRETFTVTPQPDGNNVLKSFDFLLPLSYSYSSAFCFENGNYKRISTKQIIKEWQATLNKYKPKSNISLRKKTHIESDNSLKTKSILNNTKCDDTKVNKNSQITQVTQNADLTDVQISLSNLLADNLSQTASVIKQIENIHVVEDSDSNDSLRDVTNLSVSPLTYDTRKTSNNFSFNIPSSSKNKEPLFKFGSPTLSTSPKLTFPSFEGKSKLAALAAAHLNGVGKSHPLGISKSKGFAPLTNNVSSSPLEKQSNLSALASAHLEKNSNKLGTIPALCSLGSNKIPSFSLDLKKSKEPLEGSTVNQTFGSLPKFQIPDLSLNKSKNSSMLPSTSPPVGINVDDKYTNNDCCEEKMDIVLDSDQSSVIDLKLALLSKEERERINDFNDNSDKKPLNKRIKFSIPSGWKLSEVEREYLAPQPFSLFGNTLTVDKRKSRRTLKKKVVIVPYYPFDFYSLSPDDIIRRFKMKKK